MPANAGIQYVARHGERPGWIPACAGMTDGSDREAYAVAVDYAHPTRWAIESSNDGSANKW